MDDELRHLAALARRVDEARDEYVRMKYAAPDEMDETCDDLAPDDVDLAPYFQSLPRFSTIEEGRSAVMGKIRALSGIPALPKPIERCRSDIDELANRVQSQREEFAQREEEIRELKEQERRLRQISDAEHESLFAKLRERAEEFKELRRRNKAGKAEIKTNEPLLVEAKERYDALRSKNEKIEGEINELRYKKEKMLSQKAEIHEGISKMRESEDLLQGLRTKNAELSRCENELQQRYLSLQNEISAKRAKVEELIGLCMRQQSELDAYLN